MSSFYKSQCVGSLHVAMRSKVLVCGSITVESQVSNPAKGVDIRLLCLFTGSGICDILITLSGES